MAVPAPVAVPFATLLSAPLLALALLVGGPGPVAAAQPGPPPGRPEVLVYEWRIEGLQGFLARLLGLLPTVGEGRLTTARNGDGRLECEFRATSEKAAADEHWTYRTVVDPRSWQTQRIRESRYWRGKDKVETFELADQGVIDVLSGLHALRWSELDGAERRQIWSDEKVYSVMVVPGEDEVRELGGREVQVRHLAVLPISEPGGRVWKGRGEVWLTDDARAIPVEMLYHHRLGNLRLVLNSLQ